MKNRIFLSLLAFFFLGFYLQAQPINIELSGCAAWNGTYTSPGVYTGSSGGVATSCPCYESDDANNLVIVNIAQSGGATHVWATRTSSDGTCAGSLSATGSGNLGTPAASFPDPDCDITNEGYCGGGVVAVNPTTGPNSFIQVGGASAPHDDYVEAPISTTSDLNLATGFTLELWTYSSSVAMGPIMVWEDTGVPSDNHPFLILQHDNCGTGGFRFYVDANYNSMGSLTLACDTWVHIAATFDGSGNWTLYFDGDVAGTYAGNASPSNTPGLYLRSGQGVVNQDWIGKLDEVRVWDYARTETEIESTMNLQLEGDETGLIAYYDFNLGTCGGDNTGLSAITNVANPGTDDMSMINMAQTGCESNIICAGTCPCDPLVLGPLIPTMGEWALIIFALIVLSFGVVSVMKWQKGREMQVAA